MLVEIWVNIAAISIVRKAEVGHEENSIPLFFGVKQIRKNALCINT